MKKEVGFIGLGEMGKWMALNILKNGFMLWAYDIRKDVMEEVAKHGAKSPYDLTEIGHRCNRIVFSLPDSAVVESVLFGPNGLRDCLEPGDIIIDCSTTSPVFARRASATLSEQDVYFMDAPVSGMEKGAKEGTLTIMASGDKDTYRTIYPLLEAMGKTIVYLGASGNGQLAKMTNNVLYDISCAAMAEVLPMVTKMGLDPEKICSVVRTGTGQTYGFDVFSPLVLDRNFKPGYPMKKAYKDMANAIELASKHQIPLPVTCAAMNTYQMALCQGLGGENKGAMVKVWEKALGVTVRRKEKL
jgi:3-hydroxyisobutyrate dehydrogenase-like beta-hydroxyacid dehydrogenase